MGQINVDNLEPVVRALWTDFAEKASRTATAGEQIGDLFTAVGTRFAGETSRLESESWLTIGDRLAKYLDQFRDQLQRGRQKIAGLGQESIDAYLRLMQHTYQEGLRGASRQSMVRVHESMLTAQNAVADYSRVLNSVPADRFGRSFMMSRKEVLDEVEQTRQTIADLGRHLATALQQMP